MAVSLQHCCFYKGPSWMYTKRTLFAELHQPLAGQSRRGFMGRGPPERAPANIPRLPKVPPHMDHELAFAVDLQTDATPNADPFSSVFAAASESKVRPHSLQQAV